MTAGGRIDAARPFVPLAIAVLTVSDTRDAASDTSGELLAARIAAAGHRVGARALVAGDVTAIRQQLRSTIPASTPSSPTAAPGSAHAM